MREYWVYELRAGDWLYIGSTMDPERRLVEHQRAIQKRERHERWSQALEEFPNPDDWEMTTVAGPYIDRKNAEAEEERLQIEKSDYSGRLWDRYANSTMSDEAKAKISDTMAGRDFSDEHKTNLSVAATGRKMSDEAIQKMVSKKKGQTLTDEHKEKIRKALSGENAPWFGKTGPRLGKKNSPESIAKMVTSKAAKKYAKKFFEWLEQSTQ